MKLLAAFAILALIAISLLADFFWRRWIAKMSEARKDHSPFDGRDR
ncbi:MAG TPA: hypothetical protein VL346_01160 [Acidobacteriaceae bacterium]|nr:hypothetical protein [Acidobacteriaceae bacterium]